MAKRKFGTCLVEEGFVTEARLKYALGYQRQRKEMKIGEVLLDMGHINQTQLDEVVREQMENIADTTVAARTKIGQLMVNNGMITDDQLHLALAKQHEYRNQRIGEVVVDLGLITSDQLDKALQLQMENLSTF